MTTTNSPKRPAAASKPAGRAAAPKKPTIWLVLIGVVIVGGLALAAVLSTGSNSGSSEFNATTATATGASLPAYDGAVSPDPAVGLEMPVLSGFDLDGAAMSITKDNRPKVIVYLAHWCPHCQREVPVMRDWLAANPQADVDTLSVTTGIDKTLPNYPPSKWLADEKWPAQVLVDGGANQEAAAASGLTSFPYFVVVGADGKVRQRGSGELSTDQIAALYEAARS
jgi:cytochrome c biogenesis protein CcmG, thiol:disulfide interchange protein DsbE